MSNMIEAFGEKNINPKRLAGLIDVDGCIVEPNQHSLTPDRIQIAKDLHNLTGGSFALFSDNDMRLLHPMAPFLPIISEGGAVTLIDDSRNLDDAKIIAPEVNISAMTQFATAVLNKMGIPNSTEHSANSIHDRNRIIVETKQTRMGLNWGGENQELKEIAVKVGQKALADQGLPNQFNVIAESYDCAEITPVGFTKPDRILDIANHERFKNLTVVMFGDSPIDSMAGKKVAGCVALNNRIKDADHIITRLSAPDELWDNLKMLRDYYMSNNHINHGRTSMAFAA
jgi:hydroxymethylpyrimidine pyrophosphatase-like HAD family hydrolase